MPAALDLTGRRFGQLEVIERAGKIKYGHMVPAWRCRCDCGREEIVPQPRLPTRESVPKGQRVYACEVCRQPDCITCGTKVPLSRGKKNTCSEACEQTKQRGNQLAHYYRKMAEDPDYSMKQYRRKRQRMLEDPEYAAQVRQQWREQDRRYKANKTPEQLEQEREYSRQWYAENRDYILEQRRQRLAAMSPEERAAHDEERRRVGREWRRRWRAWLEENPQEKALYRQRYREWVRERELRELMKSLEQLGEQTDE